MNPKAPGDGIRNSCGEDGLQGAEGAFWVFLHSCGVFFDNLAEKIPKPEHGEGKVPLIQRGRIWETFWECSGPGWSSLGFWEVSLVWDGI